MVDFDNETTVATPAKDVMRIYLLQNKAYTEDSWRLFREKDFHNSSTPITKVKAALEQWYLIIEPIIERHWADEKISKEKIIDIIENGNKEDIRGLIIKFNRLLDRLKLTRLDTKEFTKKTWEASNISHGY